MPDPTKTVTATATIAPSGTGVIHGAYDWLRDKLTDAADAIGSFRLSKPAAEIATAAEAALEAAGLAALEAGEASLLDVLTPAHLAALDALVGQFVASLVKAFLSRVPAKTVKATTPTKPV